MDNQVITSFEDRESLVARDPKGTVEVV